MNPASPTSLSIIDGFRNLDERFGDFIVVGHAAAALQGSPFPTDRIDVCLRHQVHAGSPNPEDDLFHLTDTPTGINGWTELRRLAVSLKLDPELDVLVLPLRDVVRSWLASSDPTHHAMIPTLLGVLEHQRSIASAETEPGLRA